MTDLLLTAAERLGVPVDASAGPESMPGENLWTRWPRHRLEVAHDVLNCIMSLHADVVVARNGSPQGWRAWVGDWFYEGSFEDTVGALGMHLTDDRQRAGRGREPLVANLCLRF
jgi:hypothetical protein